jgi:hypothetical protein
MIRTEDDSLLLLLLVKTGRVCVFAREVWFLVCTWAAGTIQTPAREVSLETWWNGSLQGTTKQQRRQIAALQIHGVEPVERKEQEDLPRCLPAYRGCVPSDQARVAAKGGCFGSTGLGSTGRSACFLDD